MRPPSGLAQVPRGLNRDGSARLLPQQQLTWAGANPTPLTAAAFDEICRPTPTPTLTPGGVGLAVPEANLAPVHRFLGCLFLRRQLQVIEFLHTCISQCLRPNIALFLSLYKIVR